MTNEHKHTLHAIKGAATWILILGAVFAALCWAGNSDYTDAQVVQMKNEGVYFNLADAHPELDDAGLVKLWREQKEKQE